MKFSATNIFSLLFLLLMAGVLPSCADSSGEPERDGPSSSPRPAKVAFSIATRAAGDGFGENDPTRDNELINDWWVFFIQDGKIASVVRPADPVTPRQQDSFIHTLPQGRYQVLAIANFDPASAGITASEGTEIPDISKMIISVANNAYLHPSSDNFELAQNLIPMTGFKEIDIDNDDYSDEIELVRLVAKIEVKIKNTSSDRILLTGLSFGRLNKGAPFGYYPESGNSTVPLLPPYENLGGSTNPLPPVINADATEKETVSIDILREIPPASAEDVSGNIAKAVFYVRESVAAPDPRFSLTLRFRRGNGSEDAEEHYAVTDELEWIQRNDHIIIPVTVTDVTVDWNVRFYPPIGGYPAVMKREEGDAHFFTFYTQGKFTIRPTINLRNDDGTPLSPDAYDFEIIKTEGTAEIFKTQPSKNVLTGEIIGELNSAPAGTAVLTCRLSITHKGETTLRERKIYITRESQNSL